jgi:hypothetical protein
MTIPERGAMQIKKYVYGAYGLGIHSVIPLPELVPLAEANADVVLKIESIDWIPTEYWVKFTDDEVYLCWDELGKFLVKGGSEVVVDPHPGVDDSLIRLPLLGTVLAVLLHQRGLLVLHASAVEIDGRAVAFLGAKGAGKSTTAAMLYARGHTLIADDIVAIDLSDSERPMLLPGFPQFKLLPDAVVTSLGDNPDQLRELVNGQPKRARPVLERFSKEPVPLSDVFILSDGPEPKLTHLNPQEAVVQLIAHTYVSRFGGELLKGAVAYRHLQQCSSLVQHVGLHRLDRPNILKLLSATANLVESQAASSFETN